MHVEIQDQASLSAFYRDCLHRAVLGTRNRAAMASQHIEVGWLPAYGLQLEVTICEGLGNAVIELGWDPDKGAWPIYPDALADCDPAVLTAWLRHLLEKHGVIDGRGMFTKRGAA
jgi:hypothetical protein